METAQLVRRVFAAAFAAALFLTAFAAGSQDELPTVAHPKVHRVIKVQEEVTPNLMASDEDILGTAVSQDIDGEMAIVVYLNMNSKHLGASVRRIPSTIGGARVNVEVTEPFRAMGGKPSSGVPHTGKQTPPIQLGTSGGWSKDLANGYCCGGTLGSLIQVGGKQYIMSNYHVFESDIVPGGNGIVATDGDPIIQPGLIDVGCGASSAQTVGSLHKLSSLPDNNVDVSVALVSTGMVSPVGSILEIGTISSQTAAAYLGQAVKKSGRTTGLSSSQVSGLNATVSVQYDNECAGGSAFTRTFTGQIIISNRGSRFLNSGDSGSLMVDGLKTNPHAVGLLYAGSSSLAVANPIGEVLEFIGDKLGGTASMVGK